MSSAEYVSVLVSIVLGLALTEVLAGLHRLLRAGPRVRWDWAAPLASVLVALVLVMMWWSFYRPSSEAVSIGAFLPSLVTLVLLYLLAGAALPDEVPPEGLDLRAYYDRNGRYFWGLFAGTLAWLIGVEIAMALVGGGELVAVLEDNLIDFGILAVFVSMALVRRRWWHVIGFLVLASGPVGWVSRSVG